jgi:hypothetical protein
MNCRTTAVLDHIVDGWDGWPKGFHRLRTSWWPFLKNNGLVANLDALRMKLIMNGKKMAYLVAGGFVATLAYFGWTLTSRSAYESAAYSVIQSDAPFEVRGYPDLLLATTQMRFASRGNDGSFSRLFSYISGANENNQKVPMTTPVLMDAESEGKPGQMGFVVPASVVANGAPVPSDGNVELRSRNGGRFAVIRFSGRLDDSTREDAELRLSQWMSTQGLTPDGDAESAGYDPPWTPGPWRRNEVLIRLK